MGRQTALVRLFAVALTSSVLSVLLLASPVSSNAPCSLAPNVAFTFTGHVRTFSDPRIVDSILDNLLRGLLPAECVGDRAHLFILPNAGQSTNPATPSGEIYEATSGMESSVSLEAFDYDELAAVLKSKFEPVVKELVFEPFDVSLFHSTYPPQNECETNPPNSTYHQYATLKNAWDSTLAYTQRTGVTFGYHVRCRFDVAYLQPLTRLPPSTLSPPDSSIHVANFHFPISDHFAIIPSNFAEAYYTGPLSLFYACPRSRMFNDEFGPNESLLYYTLRVASNIPVTYRDDIEFAIVRMGKGAECSRLLSSSEDAFNRCLEYFKGTQSLAPPYDYTVYRRGEDTESAEKAIFNVEFSYHDRPFGYCEPMTISFSLQDYNEKILSFCGSVRTDKGYIPPCHKFAQDIFHSLHKYTSFMDSEAFLQNGFVPPMLLRDRMLRKAELISSLEREGVQEEEINRALKEVGSNLDFTHSDLPSPSSDLPSADVEALKILAVSHSQPAAPPPTRTFPPLQRNVERIGLTQAPVKEEQFCVAVPRRGNTDCIPAFERGSDPAKQSHELTLEFCESRILNDGEWTRVLGLDISVEECYNIIQPELLKRISRGNYIVDLDEEISLRRGGMDPSLFFDRLNRVARVEPTSWNGYGFGAGSRWQEKFDLPLSPDDITPGEVVFVQVGAHVGRTRGDPLFPYSYKYGWSGVLVEPLPFIFDELVKNYYNPSATSYTQIGAPERPWTVAFENAALCDEVGTAQFEHVDPFTNSALLEAEGGKEEVGASDEYLYKAMGVSARGRLTEKRTESSKDEFYDFLDDAIVSTVKCITFESLMEKHKVTGFKILQVDAEGADLNVLKAVDMDKYKPELVHFEHSGMTAGERMEALTYLHGKNYICELSTIADTDCARSSGLSGPGKEGLPVIAKMMVDKANLSSPLDFVYMSQQFPMEVLLTSLCTVWEKTEGEGALSFLCEKASQLVLNSGTDSSFLVDLNRKKITVDVPHHLHPSISSSLFCQNNVLTERECKVLEERVYLRWAGGVTEIFQGVYSEK
mmetsp:Transcript_9884/g.20064  ORF Transcript_9884/g.20064 Transcript_9884/m.20064 type:complete len:1039 (-) Transcript_9884:25-3141(-)